jgi:uncharacterized protein DUF6350
MAHPLDLDADTDHDEVANGTEDTYVAPFTRFRILTLAALGPLVTGYAAVAALLAFVTAVASRAQFTTGGVLAAALPGWLAAHQVPIAIDHIELGVLPLLPTIGVAYVCVRAAAGAAERLELHRPGQAGQVIAAVAGAHAVCGLVLALLCGDGHVTADPLSAFYYPGLIAAAAATFGVARRCGLVDAVLARADGIAVAGVRAGLAAVWLLLLAGAALVTFGLLTSVPTLRELFATNAPGLGSGLGMLLLSVGYLPNAVVAGTSFLVGPGFSMGDIVVSPTEFTGGAVPGLPLLAALPEEPAVWWPLLFAIPLAVGTLVGRRLRDVAEEPRARLRAVAVAVGVVAVIVVVLAGSAGGRLGIGSFDPVSMGAAGLCVALMLWIGLPGALVAWFTGPRPVRAGTGGLLDDEDDEYAEYTDEVDDADDADDADEPAEDRESDEADDPEPPADDAGPPAEDTDDTEPPDTAESTVDKPEAE